METNGASLSVDERIAQLMKEGRYSAEKAEAKAREEFARAENVANAMAAPGALNLPPLLESKRLKYHIPDCYFTVQATYDRCFVFQVEDSKFKGTNILLAEQTQHMQKLLSPKVIIISAGLLALDNLRSHGIDLGHTVIINQFTPFKFDCGNINGKPQECMIIRDGDVCGSEELMRDTVAGKCQVTQRKSLDKSGNEIVEHVFVDRFGKTWNPQTPWIPDDG